MVGILASFWDGLFWGAMLVSGSVHLDAAWYWLVAGSESPALGSLQPGLQLLCWESPLWAVHLSRCPARTSPPEGLVLEQKLAAKKNLFPQYGESWVTKWHFPKLGNLSTDQVIHAQLTWQDLCPSCSHEGPNWEHTATAKGVPSNNVAGVVFDKFMLLTIAKVQGEGTQPEPLMQNESTVFWSFELRLGWALLVLASEARRQICSYYHPRHGPSPACSSVHIWYDLGRWFQVGVVSTDSAQRLNSISSAAGSTSAATWAVMRPIAAGRKRHSNMALKISRSSAPSTWQQCRNKTLVTWHLYRHETHELNSKYVMLMLLGCDLHCLKSWSKCFRFLCCCFSYRILWFQISTDFSGEEPKAVQLRAANNVDHGNMPAWNLPRFQNNDKNVKNAKTVENSCLHCHLKSYSSHCQCLADVARALAALPTLHAHMLSPCRDLSSKL